MLGLVRTQSWELLPSLHHVSPLHPHPSLSCVTCRRTLFLRGHGLWPGMDEDRDLVCKGHSTAVGWEKASVW